MGVFPWSLNSYNSLVLFSLLSCVISERRKQNDRARNHSKIFCTGQNTCAVKDKLLGLSLDDVYKKLMDLRHRLCNIFTVDDLKYLRKGGRLSNLSFIVGTLLQIKPLLKGNEEGKIVAFAKIRGRKKALEELAARYDQYVVDPEHQTIGIAHADCAEDAERLIALLRRNNPPEDILTVDYEPVTGSHVGPGTLALFFEARDGCRAM